jgi:hypothetical protein
MFEHQPLALVHVRRDDHFLNARQHIFARAQKIRNDSGDQAAVIQCGFGDRTHQPDRSAAVDEADVVLGKSLSQCEGSFDKARTGTGAGAAIDTDGFDLFGLDLIHGDHVALHPIKLKSGCLR